MNTSATRICIGDANVFAVREPFWLEIPCGLVRQYHQCVLDSLPACRISRNKQVDIYRRPLVAMCGERVTPYQQVMVIDTTFIERPEQQLGSSRVAGRLNSSITLAVRRAAPFRE
jgi:hypothetical protein